jgi:hypothetical protein
MYPAQALADGDYSENDLPDAVTVDGVSFNRSGTGYGNTTNGVILEGNVWVKYRNGVRSERPCLIQGGVVDQFANSYSLSGFSTWELYEIGFESLTLNRVSLCEWRSEFVTQNLSASGTRSSSGTVEVSMRLGDPFGSAIPYWGIDWVYSNWQVYYNDNGEIVPVPSYMSSSKVPNGEGDTIESSPLGEYSGGNLFSDWTVA